MIENTEQSRTIGFRQIKGFVIAFCEWTSEKTAGMFVCDIENKCRKE